MGNDILLMADFTSPAVWVSLLTLCFLEIVLGIDNIIFISIITGKLPLQDQKKVRNIGLLFAMVFRIALLLCITWIIGLKEPVVTIPSIFNKEHPTIPLSYKDLVLIAGGIFLLIKSTLEIHGKLKAEGATESEKSKSAKSNFASIIVQIVLIDMVFSFDSILTAVGLVEEVSIMIAAVVVAMCIMMLFSGAVSKIINEHPSLQMLALSFLVVIGVVLIAGGLHEEVSKSIIYSCLGFSLMVEILNIRLRKKESVVKLNQGEEKK
jgi:predicted tellurium resistance membrane protein TerC